MITEGRCPCGVEEDGIRDISEEVGLRQNERDRDGYRCRLVCVKKEIK